LHPPPEGLLGPRVPFHCLDFLPVHLATDLSARATEIPPPLNAKAILSEKTKISRRLVVDFSLGSGVPVWLFPDTQNLIWNPFAAGSPFVLYVDLTLCSRLLIHSRPISCWVSFSFCGSSPDPLTLRVGPLWFLKGGVAFWFLFVGFLSFRRLGPASVSVRRFNGYCLLIPRGCVFLRHFLF